ncbi:MAG: hypothetical protein H0U31_07245 [Chloroflexia bacterium]|nr:hypothetical protein [Chloroflexia bacterium]
MPSLDPPNHPLAAILRDAFTSQLEAGEVDLVLSEHDTTFEIQADEWTLRLEGWPMTAAFIALDEEPPSLPERQAVLDAALDAPHLAGVRRANLLLHNAIAAALEASGDQLSILLAQAIASPDAAGEIGEDD